MIISEESEESEKDNPDTKPVVPKSQNERPVGSVENASGKCVVCGYGAISEIDLTSHIMKQHVIV